MAMSTLAFFALAVAASELQAEFGISKFQLGLIGAVNTGIGAVLAPAAGRISDRIGGRNSVAGVLIFSGFSAFLLAIAPNYPLLLAASAVGGIAQGWGNPATNKAIGVAVEEAKRGVVTGIKQSGVQAAVVVAGVAVPLMSASFGWRSAMWLTAGLSFALLLTIQLVPPKADPGPQDASQAGATSPLPMWVTQVAIFGFLLGTVGGGFGRFLPLFAEEPWGSRSNEPAKSLPSKVSSPCRLD